MMAGLAVVVVGLLLAVAFFSRASDSLANHSTLGLLPQPYNTSLGTSTVECDPHGFEVDADIQVGTVPNGSAPRTQCPADDWSTLSGAATFGGDDAVFELGESASENIAVCGANDNNPNAGDVRPIERTPAYSTSAFGCDDLALSSLTDCTTHTNGDKVDDGTYSLVEGGAQPKADIANFYSAILADTNPPTAIVGLERVTTTGDTHLNVAFKQGGAFIPADACPGQAQQLSSGWSVGDLIANVNYGGGTAQPTISLFKVEALLAPDNAADLCQVTSGNLEVDNFCGGAAPSVLGLTNCNVVQVNNSLRCGTGDTDGSEIKAGFWFSRICDPTRDNPSGSAAGCRDTTTLSPSSPTASGHPETRLPQRSFIEVRIASELVNPCFANLQVQSRASGESVTSALSDVGEAAFPGCKIRIEKRDADTNALIGGATFRIDPTPFRLPACAASTDTIDVTDDTDGVAGPGPDTNPAPGIIELSPVCDGTYSVLEIAAPGGYALNPTAGTCVIVDRSCTVVITNPLGTLEWEKRDESTGGAGSHPLQTGATFRIAPNPYWCHSDTLNGSPTPGAAADGSLDVADTNTGDGGSTTDPNDFDTNGGQLWIKRVCLATYTVTELTAPAGYALDDDATRDETVSDKNNLTDDDGDTVVDDAEEFNAVIGTGGSPPPPTQPAPPGTDDDGNTDESDFHNRRGSLLFLKDAKDKTEEDGVEPFCCATFSVTGTGFSASVKDNENPGQSGRVADLDPADGRICIDAVPLNVQLTISETASNSAVYDKDETTRSAKITTSSQCVNRTSDTPDVATPFFNTPLSEIEIIFRSLAGTGKTQLTQPIACEMDATPTPIAIDDVEATPTPNDSPGPSFDDAILDRDEVFTDLLPGTYNCTIVIDP